MAKNDGHINAALISKSRRLQIIADLFKKAEHPLSSEEIAKQAYQSAISGRFMLNVSTNIGEMRSADNIAEGYVVSHAAAWKSDRYPWHDGRPRYWLLAAPGWTPRWTIGDGGVLNYGVQGTGSRVQESTATASHHRGTEAQREAMPQAPQGKHYDEDLPRACKYLPCGKTHDEVGSFCSEGCRKLFFEQLKQAAGAV